MTNAQWYYVDIKQQRIGPMEPADLVDALRHGQLNLASLVWQEGMPAWQPLSLHLDELAVPEILRASRKSKSSNTAIWVLVIVAGGFGLIAILGILAAIAIPAYQDYTVRAKLSQAITQGSAQQQSVTAYLATHSECPNNNSPDTSFAAPASFANAGVQRIDMGALANGNCAVEMTLSDTLAPGVISGTVIFELVDPKAIQWRCSSDTIKDRYLPATCRTGSGGR